MERSEGRVAQRRGGWPRTGVCALTVRAEADRLVFVARYKLDLRTTSVEHRFATADIDELIGLLRRIAQEVRGAP